LGENFAVNLKEGNVEGVDFYILLCIRTMFTFSKPFTCPWGHQFCIGDMVVVGRYYQKWGHGESSCVLLRRFEVFYIYVCHVRVFKFPMLPTYHKVQGNDLVYKLPKFAKDDIRQNITFIQL
jgi:hypothetical protein